MANQMTKAQLVAALAERTGGDKKAASGMLDALTGIITETVAQGGAVMVWGPAASPGEWWAWQGASDATRCVSACSTALS